MLILARSDTRRQTVPQSPVDVSDLVCSELLRFEPLFFEADLHLDWDVEEKLLTEGNEPELKKLTSILLDNALKYTTPGGCARLVLRREDSRFLTLQVSSDGAPISPEDLPRLFDRFYRADPARSGSDRGHGLGLSIAKAIVQDHRGQIRAESRDGRNTFFVRLPRKRK